MRTRLEERGITTIESVVVLSLLGFVLLGMIGLHLLAISAGTAAETSSIAANLARARLEELLGMTPSRIIEQNNAETLEQVAPGQSRTYTVSTRVDAPDPNRLDITVTVTWQGSYNSACAPGKTGASCSVSTVTYTRTLQTRIHTPGNL